MYVVKVAVLLKALFDVDREAMLEVLEQTEGSRLLGETIRVNLLQKLAKNNEDPFIKLKKLFQEIDTNHSNKLRYNLLNIFLSHYSH
jgi:hypothetical protein